MSLGVYSKYLINSTSVLKMLSLEQRTWLVEYVFKAGGKYTLDVQQQFTDNFQRNPPHRDTVRDLISKFRSTGSVLDAERSGRPVVLTEMKLNSISDKILQKPETPMRRLAQEVEVSKSTVHKAVRKELKLYPYKIMSVHQLKQADYEKRMHYCRWFNNLLATKGNDILDNVFYSDEAWFHLSGYVHSQNSRLWSAENPHAFHESPLHDLKVGVWIAISRSRIVGPIFFHDTINSQRYRDNILTPFTESLTLHEIQNCFFQQDGATAHTAKESLDFLRHWFDDRIISKNLWPPRSPDLSPPDFYVWGAAKACVYKDSPETIEELQAAIRNFINSVNLPTLQKVFESKCRRVNKCLELQGQHFQHVL